jgi:hypothetical protein
MKQPFPHSFVRALRVVSSQILTGFAFALLATFALAEPAFAATGTLGDIFCNSSTNLQGFGHLYSACAFIMGVGFMGWGFYELVKHHDNPRERPMHHPLMKISGGAALMAAPYVAQALINTFYTTGGGGGLVACTAGAVTATTSGNVGLDVLIQNLTDNIKGPLDYAMGAIAIVIGLFMIVRGLLKASKYGVDPRTHSLTSILSNLTVGTLLIVVGQTTDAALGTLFGINWGGVEGGGASTGASTVGGWTFVQDLNAGQQFINSVAAALLFFQLVGMIAFVRGWMIMKSAAEGQGQATMAQGITHILGGAVAMNVFNFLEMMDNTFGTGFLL